jgi:hypothetical protein
MTWVIGVPVGGFAIGVADTRVSVDRQPVTGFGVQKLHQVSHQMVVGFSGSIELGFEMVDALAEYVLLSGVDPGRDLGVGLTNWTKHLATTYRPDAGGNGVSLLVLAASATVRFGPDEVDLGMPLCHGGIVRTPSAAGSPFQVQGIPHLEARSIGSGAGVEAYRQALERLATRDTLVSLFRFQQFAEGTPGLVLADQLTRTLEQGIEPTVSQDLHIAVVGASGVVWTTNESITGRRMDRIAATWEEVLKWASSERLAAANLRA